MNAHTRNTQIEDVATASYDVIIIGGGINGASTFRELALNGVSVLLVDRQDFCAGASAAPSRLIHGGIKYLENGEFRLVAESTVERNRLLHNAPHLVKPLPCTIPFYSWFGGLFNSAFSFFELPTGKFKKRGWIPVKLGLMIYDWMGRKHRVVPTHRSRGAAKSRLEFTGLDASVVATATYYDALIVQPERLCLELITDTLKDVPNRFCTALSYTRVLGLEGSKILFRDEVNGREFALEANMVVNAAGPWVDKVNQILDINTHYIGGSKGSHLVVDHPELQACLKGHMLYFETGDNRLCLAYAIGDRVLIGTTDIPIDDADTVQCEEEEVDYLISVMAELLPSVKIARDHIVYCYSGVRPLPFDDGVDIGKVSRDHSIELDESTANRNFAVASLVGGKWTTFRAFGEVAADLVLQRLQKTRQCHTHSLGIGGGRGYPNAIDRAEVIASFATTYGLTKDLVDEVLTRYGVNAAVLETLSINEQAQNRLVTIPRYRVGEIRYMCNHERVVHLDDLIFRRTTLALEGRANVDVITEIAEIAAPLQGWDEAETAQEIEHCVARISNSLGVGVSAVVRYS